MSKRVYLGPLNMEVTMIINMNKGKNILNLINVHSLGEKLKDSMYGREAYPRNYFKDITYIDHEIAPISNLECKSAIPFIGRTWSVEYICLQIIHMVLEI